MDVVTARPGPRDCPGASMLEPVGFWSYARHDDQHSDGELSQLRVIVGKAIGLQYGAEVTLWQDVAAIPFGADWPETIERTLDQTTFFVPILTPRFLKSPNCRDEYAAFRQRMAALGRNDLVFPVHYVDVARMSAADTVFGDEFAALHRHQWIDFRPLFYADPQSREVKRWAGNLAGSVLTTLQRHVPAPRRAADDAPAGAEAPTAAPETGSSTPMPVDPSPVTLADPIGDSAAKIPATGPVEATGAALASDDPRVAAPEVMGSPAPRADAEVVSTPPHGTGVVPGPDDAPPRLEASSAGAADADAAQVKKPGSFGLAAEGMAATQLTPSIEDSTASLTAENASPSADPGAKRRHDEAVAATSAVAAPAPATPLPAQPSPAPDEAHVAPAARQDFWARPGATRRAAILGGLGLGATAAAVGLTRSWFNDASRATLTGHAESVSTVTFAPAGFTLASGSYDGAIKIWNVGSGALLRTLEGHSGRVFSIAFAPDGRTIASGSDDAALWEAASGARQRTLLEENSGAVYSIAFAPDGRMLASGSSDHAITLLDSASGAPRRTLDGHSAAVKSVAFAPDGRMLASGSLDDTIKLWLAASGTLRRTLEGHSNWVNCVAFAPDGRTLASGSDDKTIRLWDAASGAPQRTLEGHSGAVFSVAFSPDGRTLASGSADETIKLWDSASGALQRTLDGHSNTVFSVAFSPDGRTLASGSADNTIKLWNIG